MRSFGAAAAVLSAFFLAGGLIWPHWAARLLDLLIAILAVAYIGARAYGSRLPSQLASDAYSPFERHPAGSPILKHAAPLHDLAISLRAADEPETVEKFAIPLAAQRIVSIEAARRLTAGHDLSLSEPSHHLRIQRLVSEPMWALIRPNTEHPNRPLLRNPVPLRHLGDILDELEAL